MRYQAIAIVFAYLAFVLAVTAQGKSSKRSKLYEEIKALPVDTARSVCQIILFDTRPRTTVVQTITVTVQQDAPPQSQPGTITITDTVTDAAPTTTLTATSTSTTYIATTLNPSSPPALQKRHQSKHDRNLAHHFLRHFDRRPLRSVCIDILYQGNSSQASTSTVRATTTATVTQTPIIASVTSSTKTQTTHTVLSTVSITEPTDTVTTSATKTVYLSLPTDSASYCTAQGAGCSCVVGTDSSGNAAITCTYVYVGQPSFFVAPCSGKLAARLQGGSSGQSYASISGSDASTGSLVTSPAIGSDSSSAAINTFSSGSRFVVKVGGTGTDASEGTTTFGRGGYNGGGNGGCTAVPGFQGGVCAGGGGGATDLSYDGQVILAAGGAGGGAEGHSSRPPTTGSTDTSDPQPQGGSANGSTSGSGGGGGGGYPGGVNGFYDQSPGYAGFSRLSSSSDQTTFPGTLQGPTAVLTFTCTAP